MVMWPEGRICGWMSLCFLSFDLFFDKSDILYFPGDTVVVSGKVKSFSGHRLSGVSAVALVRVSGAAVSSGPLDIMDDGSFSVSCVAGKARTAIAMSL